LKTKNAIRNDRIFIDTTARRISTSAIEMTTVGKRKIVS